MIHKSMKKESRFIPLGVKKRVKKIKGLWMLLIGLCFLGSQTAVAQETGKWVTLDLQEVTMKAFVGELQRQTGYAFFYKEDVAALVEPVTVSVANADLSAVLEEVLGQKGCTFTFEGETVVIRKRVESQGQVEERKVIGVVKDEHGQPLPGVAVVLKGTTVGTATDMDGNYALTLPKGNYTLVFSMLGMKVREEQVGDRTEINVVMQEEAAEMDEVVVTGIFTKPKESYTGAETTITSKDLQRVGNRNILNSIRNIDPSFNIVENIEIGSDPNKLPDITVRGSSSLDVNVRDLQSDAQSISNLPLFIMDGFEISLERMMDLDENQVESITLLKDASATAMYGTRGANGVVVITTKKPEPGKLLITYKGSLNIEAPDLSSYNLMNAREKLAFEKAAGLYEYSRADDEQDLIELYNSRLRDVERGVDTYWLKYPVRTGVGNRHSLRFEGGTDELRYAASLAYNNVAGAMKGSIRNTFNGNVFLSYKYKNVTFQNDLLITSNKAKNSPYGTFSDYGKINAYWKPYDDEGNLLKKLEDGMDYLDLVGTNTVYNPLWNAMLPSLNESKYTEIQDHFAIEWHILPELFVRGRFGVTAQTNRSDVYVSAEDTQFDSYTGEDVGRRGSYTYGTGESFSYEADFTLNYSKLFADRHQLYVGLGYNFAESRSESYSITAEGISNVNMDFLGSATLYEKDGAPYGDESVTRRVGGILNINYTFDRRYFVDLSGKFDGSSQFGSDNRLAPFYSIGAGWNMHNEAFMGNAKAVNTARLRLSYGTSGSQSFSAYQALTTFKNYGSTVYNTWYGIYMMAMGNEDLGWQVTHQLNLGLELELFNGRLRLNADVYNKLTNDLLSDITLPSSAGFNTYKANVGKVQNRGVELNLNAYLIRNTVKEIFWSVGGTLARNKNEIKEISNSLKFLNEELLKEDSANPSFLYEEGQSMNTIFAVPSLGIDPSNGKEIFVKRDGALTYTWDADDKVPCGIAEPKIWGNLNTMFRWKGLSFNAVFSYRYGGQMYNSTLVSKVENIQPYENADRRAYYDRWKTPGENALYKKVGDFTDTKASSRFVMDENTLECRTLSLEYEWTSEWLERNLSISYLSLAGYMEDVFRISTIKQERGLDYPFSHKFSLSLSVRF